MKTILLILLTLLAIKNISAQELDYFEHHKKLIDLSFNLNYITGAKVYLTPRASDPDLRNLYYTFDGFLSYSFEIKANVWNNFVFAGVSTEYLRASELLYSVRALVNNLPRTLQVEETFYLYPVEILGYYVFPFSRDWYTVYMGAGLGVYFGKYERKIFNLKSESKISRLDYGILVSAGAEINLIQNLRLKLEMKFRDPELEFKNTFPETPTIVNGNNVQIFEKTFYTKINVDGINLILGLNYRF
ncbi:MAG: hypothetical protein ACPL25_03195 [Ignavibacteria bacterium]